MLDDAINNLIFVMEEKINEIRFNLLNIQNEKVVDELINNIKPQVLDLFVDFDGVDNAKIEHIKNLKGELLKLLSLYEE
ncbi:hypothetical protein [Vibrio harveyi]|uniref:hypothetical protein n=1 Tax=Vibrio harveyi TaxID=669 RepID=UPI00031DCFA3|nr:hypothetical protein [Vibrio harveyi]WDZ73175.1 hypothetical protein PWW31_06190 [Vibrio harveyi]CAH1524696.1 conserved hypothetical protein [Vibrio harveyi]HDM8069840.1 hypothetical protein [Vibrio harveyi]HDZ5417473.1 hypothetical protein [Vibrio harveyi]